MTDVSNPERERHAKPSLAKRFRWIYLAPLLAFIVLGAWAFASPIGAGPDDDYHLVSTWCADGGNAQCQPGPDAASRSVDAELHGVICYAQHPERSAACQSDAWDATGSVQVKRGNFTGEYPPVYYAVMHAFAGPDVQVSALVMRVFNAALFVGLATALAMLLPLSRRRTLLWGWLIALIPLGVFIIPSNNPSGWAITGVGTAFLALLGWFETTGRRRWALGALYVVGMIMAAGSRGDAAVYAVGATVTAAILTASRTREWGLRAILPLAGIVVALVFFANATQASIGAMGFTGGEAVADPGVAAPSPAGPSGMALAAYNLLALPGLWTGVWGTWSLGWFDTVLPTIVPWAAVSAFLVVAFAGLGRLDWRKAISVGGVLMVLVVLPTYVLTVGGMRVGEALQPRYLLPLILLFSLLLVTMPPGRELRFSRVQMFTIFGALSIANLVALHVNIRRYISGVGEQGLNLDSAVKWWWVGFPISPNLIWIIGVLAFAGLLVVLWPQLRRPTPETLVRA